MSSQKGAVWGLNFARIVRQMNVSRQFISDSHVKVISHGGFPYEAFNVKAHISPWSILRLVEFSRNTAFNKFSDNDQCFLELDKIYDGYMIFIAATRTKISQQLYDYSNPKGPMEIHVKLHSIGNSSFSLKHLLYLPGVDSPVVECDVQSVFIDAETRKPSPPPEWWRQKYAAGLEDGKPFKVEKLDVPESGFLTPYQVKISASDLDTYWHTNWSNYVRFSYEAFINHAVTKYGTGNMVRSFRKCKEFSALYMKEANITDVIDVRVWKIPGNQHLFNFQHLRGSEVICQSQIELYPHVDGE